MSLENVMSIAASGMTAQSVRLNTVASNLANSDTISGTEQGAYRAKAPQFQTVYANALNVGQSTSAGSPGWITDAGMDGSSLGVGVQSIVDSSEPIRKQYRPDNPLADKDGFVYLSNVNSMDEMANMIDASREYQMNVEMMNTSKNLIMKLLSSTES